MLEVNNAKKLVEREVSGKRLMVEYVDSTPEWHIFVVHPGDEESVGCTFTAVNKKTGEKRRGGPEILSIEEMR
jgi:hypothetical protein